ncbi:MAG: gluconokinase [Ardenticatenaceae bacterium]|nr:gluconokinase [Ardenticatenaceae bacterium]
MTRSVAATRSPLVLALDLGTSAVRAIVYDRWGRTVEGLASQVDYSLHTTADGGVEADPTAMVAALETVLDAVLARAGSRADQLVAVGFSMLVSNVLGIGAGGQPLTPVYTYADTRSAPAAAALRSRLNAHAVHQRTGAPLHASYLPARLLWLQQSEPEQFRRVVRWLSVGEYFYLQLFGEARASLSVASWTGLLNRQILDWDHELLAAVGVSPTALSPLGDLHAPARGLRPAPAARWPALARVPWLLPVADGACNNIGAGCLSPARVALMIGTSGAMRVVLPDDSSMRVPAGLWLYRVDRRRALLGGATSEGGSLYAWLRATLRLNADDSALESALAALPPDSHGLTVLPFLAGERSPGWNDAARAAIVGLSLDTTPKAITRAGLEAVAYRFGLLFERLRPHLPPDATIIASGGALQHSPLWTQMFADVLARPVVLSGESEASSRGAALLALEALSLLEELQMAPAALGRAFEPDPERHEIYVAAMGRQQALYQALFGPGRAEGEQSRSANEAFCF